MASTRNFGDVIRAKIAADPDLARAIKQENLRAHLAQKIYDLRQEAGLTQKQLAKKIDLEESVIARLEDADYDDPSLDLLEKIAAALGKDLSVTFLTKSHDVQEITTAI